MRLMRIRESILLGTGVVLSLSAISLIAQNKDKYSGPVPPKPDVVYLMHANNLVQTETGTARQENRKNDANYVIAGASSPARTPLAEPVFIIDAQKIAPDRMELYKLDIKNGNREVSISFKPRKGGRLFLSVTKLSGHLYKIEANQPLENGEYAISPSGGNEVFCFQVY
jgi:hypothetical protein